MITTPAPTPLHLHASCVAVDGKGLLIFGRSGSGKSSLALQLIALGAGLVSDDQTIVSARDGELIAAPPTPIAGTIEARYLGLLSCPVVGSAAIALAVDLDQTETERLPPFRQIGLAGLECALAYFVPAPHFAAALYCYLRYGRRF